MAEAAIEPAASSSKDDDESPLVSEPKAKKRKVSDGEANEKLEHRLGGILCCAVCLDLPRAAVYQCSNGHLMCAACFTHLLADARLRDDAAATCPNCRIEISHATATRNLAVEKAVSELPSECKYCTRVFPRHSLHHHEENTCDDRQYKFAQIVVSSTSLKTSLLADLIRLVSGIVALVVTALRRSYLVSERVAGARRPKYRRLMGCRFACIGCPWRGPAHSASEHEAQCAHPSKCAGDVLPALAQRDQRHAHSTALFNQLLDLLSYENITFNDLELKPYRTEEFVHKLYYESLRFTAFGHQWVVKAFVNKNQRDPTQSVQREITYQLVLRSKAGAAGAGGVAVQWAVVRGPHGAAPLAPALAAHTYRADSPEPPPRPLPLLDPADTNRLLANRAIHFRLIMFQA